MRIIAALTDPDSLRRYLEGVGLHSRPLTDDLPDDLLQPPLRPPTQPAPVSTCMPADGGFPHPN